ncbi:MAG: hypothetical protein P4M00_13455 [Azospirillaceae bacterium]|nr:hypothetical protein [Azospirillaceae bacterium]
MAISPDDLHQLEALLAAPDVGVTALAQLRLRLPHLSWTRCDASDVGEPPFHVVGRFDIHLVDSTDHCTRITADPTRATGVVLAQRSHPS